MLSAGGGGTLVCLMCIIMQTPIVLSFGALILILTQLKYQILSWTICCQNTGSFLFKFFGIVPQLNARYLLLKLAMEMVVFFFFFCACTIALTQYLVMAVSINK